MCIQWIPNPKPYPPNILMGRGSAMWDKAHWQKEAII